MVNIKIVGGYEGAKTLGLLINEIVNNSIKYAISKTENGVISISLKNCYSLVVKDNGKGFPADFNFDKSNSL